LAWCYINRQDFEKAIQLFEEAVATSESGADLDIDTYKKVDIKLESLIDMAFCYTEVRKDSSPEEAIGYFGERAWSRPSFTVALEKLAYRYLIKKKWHHAAAVYRKLGTLQHDAERLLEYAANVFECVQEMESFDDASRDMDLIVRALKKQKYSVHIPDEEKFATLEKFELYARDIVTHLHYQARELQKISHFAEAADAYEKYLEFFVDSPVRDEMESNYAETLFSANRYVDAGKEYEKLANADSNKGSKTEETLYSAVLSYHMALQDKKDLNYYEKAYARTGLKTTGRDYVAKYPDSTRVPDVLFNVAWITYDQGNHDEAIAELSKFVDAYPKGKQAKAAIHLVLDAYHLKEDYEGLVAYGQQVLGDPRIDVSAKAEVANIVQAAESKVLHPLTVAAVEDWGQGRNRLMEFADGHAGSSLGEQALQTALVAADERNDLATLFQVGEKLIAEYPKSAQLEETLNVMINAAVKSAQYRLLARYLEEFAYRLPKNENRTEFLLQAANLRAMLGQRDRVNHDYNLILEAGFKKDGERDWIVVDYARNAKDLGTARDGLDVLEAYAERLSGGEEVKANALLATLYLETGERDKAEKHSQIARAKYQTNVELWDGTISDAMAEMEYSFLSRVYEAYMKLHLGQKVDKTIVEKKTKLLQQLEAGYQKLVQYKAPEWALSACCRWAEVNKEFARFLIESPLPDLNAEQTEQYKSLLNEKAKPYLNKYEECLSLVKRLARKWAICRAELIEYYDTGTERKRTSTSYSGKPPIEIGDAFLRDEALLELHQTIMKSPENIEGILACNMLI
jgi:tetratricopeptide (TPR) repeat protein